MDHHSINYTTDLEVPSLDRSILSFYNSDDSILSLQNLMPEKSFVQLASEMKMQHNKVESIVNKFYRGNKGQGMILNPYYTQYLEWKDKKEDSLEISLRDEGKAETQEMREGYVEWLRVQNAYQREKYAQEEVRKRIKGISSQYQQKLKELMKAQSFIKKKKEENKPPSMEKISLPSFHLQPTRTKESPKKTPEKRFVAPQSYQNLIRRPPNFQQSSYSQHSPSVSLLKEQQPEKQQEKQKEQIKYSWKLDINKILEMPPHQYLSFYSSYQNKLRAMSSVEEWKRLKKYRDDALEREKAIYKVKEKLASGNKDLVERLSPERKKQLFELLYEDELQDQIERQNKLIESQRTSFKG